MTLRIQCLTVDSHNPRALAEFWAKVLNWSVNEQGDEIGWWIEREIGDPSNSGFPDILFLKVDEAKSVKNRLHLDLRPDDQEAEVARLENLGAKRISIGQDKNPNTSWVVMADPEGNEFCVLRALNGHTDAN